MRFLCVRQLWQVRVFSETAFTNQSIASPFNFGKKLSAEKNGPASWVCFFGSQVQVSKNIRPF
jgi:hypothetical protein